MDEMVAASEAARVEKLRSRKEEEMRGSKTFGAGLKGGFFASADNSAPVPKLPIAAERVCAYPSCTTLFDRISKFLKVIHGGVFARALVFSAFYSLFCLLTHPFQRPVKKCGRCKSVWYCSAGCQRAHWSMHKSVCGAATAASLPNESIPTIRTLNSAGHSRNNDRLVLPEVQAAMSESGSASNSASELSKQLEKGGRFLVLYDLDFGFSSAQPLQPSCVFPSVVVLLP